MASMNEQVVMVLDTREPGTDIHPWVRHWPPSTLIVRNALETGDVALLGHEEEYSIERKAVSDLVSCLGAERERLERELRRARNLAGFAVVVEGTFGQLLQEATIKRGFNSVSVIATIAAWTRRHCPFIFCESQSMAAEFAWRFLTGPLREAEERLQRARGAMKRTTRAVERSEPEPEPDTWSPF